MTTPESQMDKQKHKKNSTSLVPSFLQMPWWANIILAIASYYSFKYLIPQLQFNSQTLRNFASAAPGLAPITAIIFLLLAAMGLYDTDSKKLNEDTEEHNSTDT